VANGNQVFFFVRFSVVLEDGTLLLPILWSDNYVTLFPQQSVTLHAGFKYDDEASLLVTWTPWNTPTQTLAVSFDSTD
jgi:hypothetical protein